MHPQLREVADEFAAAQARLHRLADSLPEDWWPKRPDPTRWSVAQCVAHVNLASRAYLPLLHRGLEDHRREADEGRNPPVRRAFPPWPE